MAKEMLDTFSGINYVVASDRKVWHGRKNNNHYLNAQTYSGGNVLEFFKNYYNGVIMDKGFKLFDGTQEIFLGYQYKNLVELLDDAIGKIQEMDNK